MVKQKNNARVRRLIFAALLISFTALGVIAAVHLITAQSGYAQAQEEYTALRQYAPDRKPDPKPTPKQLEAPGQTHGPEPILDLSAVNPDYIGWIRIDGTMIDYPVVRGEDNKKYISTTFTGEQNASGAIFMDYRCVDGFGGAFAILYGHNMKDGSMFAALNRYLESGYLDEHPNITILRADGAALDYCIFAVRKTDITDSAYRLPDRGEKVVAYMKDLGAPEGAERFLVLSTCTSSRDDDERLLVFGVIE